MTNINKNNSLEWLRILPVVTHWLRIWLRIFFNEINVVTLVTHFAPTLPCVRAPTPNGKSMRNRVTA